MSPSAGRAEQRIGDRVEHDVGVAVAGEAARRGEWRFRRASPGLRRRRRGRRSPCPVRGDSARRRAIARRGEVGGRGQFFERRIAFDRGDAHPGGADHAGLVGRGGARPVDHRRRASAASRNACGVWTRTSPVRSTGSSSCLAGAGQRVADRQHRRGAFEEFERREQPVDDRRAGRRGGRRRGPGPRRRRSRQVRRGPNPRARRRRGSRRRHRAPSSALAASRSWPGRR